MPEGECSAELIVLIMLGAAATFRTLPLSVSAMKMFPVLSTATPSGSAKTAAIAGPLSPENPVSPVPAIVAIAPVALVTFRIC